jgi:hypothetical protein
LNCRLNLAAEAKDMLQRMGKIEEMLVEVLPDAGKEMK